MVSTGFNLRYKSVIKQRFYYLMSIFVIGLTDSYLSNELG